MRYSITIIGTKGDGFTHMAVLLSKAYAMNGYKVVGRIQPQSNGATGRKFLRAPFLGDGNEDVAIATTEKVDDADLIILIGTSGHVLHMMKNAKEGAVVIANASNAVIRRWTPVLKEIADERGIRLVDIDVRRVTPHFVGMFLVGIATAIAPITIKDESLFAVLKELNGEELGKRIYEVVKMGIEYGKARLA